MRFALSLCTCKECALTLNRWSDRKKIYYAVLFALNETLHVLFSPLSRSSDAICQTFDLQLGDIVILSTDGLFDNVSDRLIEQILAHVNFLFSFLFVNDLRFSPSFVRFLESIIATCRTIIGRSSCTILSETG